MSNIVNKCFIIELFDVEQIQNGLSCRDDMIGGAHRIVSQISGSLQQLNRVIQDLGRIQLMILDGTLHLLN